MPVDAALIEAMLAPIAGDNAAGKDLRYDPRYDQVKEARREDLELPPGGLATERKLADWPRFFQLSSKLLQSETKDLQLAAWLTEGLLKRDGLAGLATGAKTIHGFIDKFWDGCYPSWDEEDPELRAGPLQWVGSKLDLIVRQSAIAPGTSLLEYEVSRTIPTEAQTEGNKEKRLARAEAIKDGKRPPEEVDRVIAEAPKAYYKALVADADAAVGAVTQLEGATDERFGRDAPSFGKLRSAIDDLRRVAAAVLAQKLIDDPDPIVEEVVAVSGDGAAADGPLTPEPVSVADAALRVGVSARYLRAKDPTNPAPYLMLRGLRWGELRATATAELDPKLLEAPSTALRSRIKALLLDGKWSDLLEVCETVMATSQGRGWLDLQRYVLAACDNLGAGYDAVAAAVRDELRTLLHALPQLPEMTLMDDAPTANPETQAWLAAEGLTGAGASEAPPVTQMTDSSIGDGSDSLDVALEQDAATSANGGFRAGPRRRPVRDPFVVARAELAQGRPHRAIELLLAEVAREHSPRGRFIRQTQVAYVMVESGLETVARPILERLVSTIDERKLEDWEAGPLVAQPLALLCRVMDKMEEGASSDRRNLYLRICRLDAMQAIALQR